MHRPHLGAIWRTLDGLFAVPRRGGAGRALLFSGLRIQPMKKIPALVCALIGLALLPWHLMLPDTDPPFPDAVGPGNSFVDAYRQKMAAAGSPDTRDDYFVMQDLISLADKNPDLLTQYPDFGQQYRNWKWYGHRRPSYYARFLQNIYGEKKISWSLVWVVPVALGLIYISLHFILTFLRPVGKRKAAVPAT
jgi:hypothetical protein